MSSPLTAQGLLLTEVMADPAPPLGILPVAEYVELTNFSETTIDLGGLTLATRHRAPHLLGRALLAPGGRVILCAPRDTAALAPFGAVLGVEGFPTLRNDGDEILLMTSAGDTILRQAYHPDWHRDPGRTGGGWSLELIDPALPANCDLNWASSQDPRGGTPGMPNSHTGIDAPPPSLLQVFPVSPTEISLVFSAALDQAAATDTRYYTLEPAIPIAYVLADFPASREVKLVLEKSLARGQHYDLHLSSNLPDCLGRTSTSPTTVPFALPATMEAGDLVINEILFDPLSGGSPFIELFNLSTKVLNLRDLFLVNHQATSSTRAVQVEDDYLLFPAQYVVFTPSLTNLLRDYQVERVSAVVETKLPALGRDRGNISLHYGGLTIDSLDYDQSLHAPLLADPRGVSLERIDPEGPTQSPFNWHSAAQTSGFATPTSRNSQYQARGFTAAGTVSLPAKIFSPDGDGFEDFLLIHYQADRPGSIIHLSVFDEAGRRVRTLADGQLLGAQGSFKWDGTTLSGETGKPGIYILSAEILEPGGQSRRYREVCVLAVALK